MLAVLFLFAGPVAAQQWKPIDYTLAVSSTVMRLADWTQTIDIARRGGGEGNPLIGLHPSVGHVNAYFGAILATNLLATRLPATWRRIFYASTLAMSTVSVAHNRANGLRFNFSF